MDFDTFLKKIDSDFNPDKAYKMYLQVQITILEEILINRKLVSQEDLNKIQKRVLEKIIKDLSK